MSDLSPFRGQPYLNLETYKRSGQAVPTPVWFVEHEDHLYVRTIAYSGKVKRVRNNPQVRVAPCDARGELLGEWSAGQARVASPEKSAAVNQLLGRKYGLRKRLFDLMNALRRTPWAVIEIELNGSA